MRLFAASLHPTLDALDAWLASGHLPSSPFLFIHPGLDVSPEAPGFWEQAYTTSLSGSYGSSCSEAAVDTLPMTCPEFLQPLAAGILAAGKSAILLQSNSSSASRCWPSSQPNQLLSGLVVAQAQLASFGRSCHSSCCQP